MGIKGGIARKIFKIMVGVPKDAPFMKSEVCCFYKIQYYIMRIIGRILLEKYEGSRAMR